MYQAVQSKCINDVDIQSSHEYGQCDACLLGHTSYLTEGEKMKKISNY